jgi:hypothetical protein
VVLSVRSHLSSRAEQCAAEGGVVQMSLATVTVWASSI